MVLSYYGYNYSESLLLQLSGWDYGAAYMPSHHFGYGLGLYPVVAIIRTCRILGFSVNYINEGDFSKALSKVKEALANSTPVIIQLRGHTVVAVGFTDDSLLIHDPSGGIFAWRGIEEIKALNLSKSGFPPEVSTTD